MDRTNRTASITRAAVITLICSSVFILSSWHHASADGPGKYYYIDNGRPVTMTMSKDLVVIQRTGNTKGKGVEQILSGMDLAADPLSERLPQSGRAMTIFRLPRQGPATRGGETSLREQVQKLAEEDALVYQPVFEQGQSLFIPTAELLVGMKNVTDPAEAKVILEGRGKGLGVIGIDSVGNNVFRLTIDNPGDGRCYEVSRQLDAMNEVDFAEPNHLIILLDQEDSSAVVPDNLVVSLNDLIAGPVSRSVNDTAIGEERRADLAPNWELVAALDGEEQTFPPPGWQLRKKNSAPDVFWGKTDYRRHSGSSSIYCAGQGSDAAAAPGPVPPNTYAVLVSPPMDLSGYDEAYVEVWFYAKNEIIKDEKGEVVSGDFSVLVVTDGEKNSVSPLFVGYVEDATLDPTTRDGWRKLLVRIDPALRTKPVQLMFTSVSNASKQVEGTYIDDIRVIASSKVAEDGPLNDPYSGRQYELKNTGQVAGQGNENNDMNVVEAWGEVDVSPNIVVAVLDDGVDLGHPDLNLIQGYNADGTAGGGPASDTANHGTSVAGNVGAIGRNGIGVIGTAPNIKIMPINFGGSTALDFANAIDTAVNKGAHILNNSWGFNGVTQRVIELAVHRALAAGRVVLFAAGNGPDRPPFNYEVYFPGNMTGSSDVITVGASSQTDEHKSAASADGQFSWGSSYRGPGPDICAPGPWSYTTDRIGPLGYNSGASGIDADYHHNFGGTSAATPKVAGIVALMLSANSDLTPAQVKRILQESADDIEAPGFDDTTGAGRVNALAAVRLAKALKQNVRTVPDDKGKRKSDDLIDPGVTDDNADDNADDNGFQKVLDW